MTRSSKTVQSASVPIEYIEGQTALSVPFAGAGTGRQWNDRLSAATGLEASLNTRAHSKTSAVMLTRSFVGTVTTIRG